MSEYRTGYFRRGLGILLFVIPFALASASVIVHPFSPYRIVAVAIGCLALMISILNFWLSFLRPLLWERKHRGTKDYRYVSGLPAIGTILAVVTVLVGFGHPTPAIIAFVVLLIDSGGLPWFVVWTWRDCSLWDVEIETTDSKRKKTNG